MIWLAFRRSISEDSSLSQRVTAWWKQQEYTDVELVVEVRCVGVRQCGLCAYKRSNIVPEGLKHYVHVLTSLKNNVVYTVDRFQDIPSNNFVYVQLPVANTQVVTGMVAFVRNAIEGDTDKNNGWWCCGCCCRSKGNRDQPDRSYSSCIELICEALHESGFAEFSEPNNATALFLLSTQIVGTRVTEAPGSKPVSLKDGREHVVSLTIRP
jgi:hypothetical protein